jgi:hypothetical protein
MILRVKIHLSPFLNELIHVLGVENYIATQIGGSCRTTRVITNENQDMRYALLYFTGKTALRQLTPQLFSSCIHHVPVRDLSRFLPHGGLGDTDAFNGDQAGEGSWLGPLMDMRSSELLEESSSSRNDGRSPKSLWICRMK